MAQRQQSAWKRIHYTFDILNQATEVKLGTLEVDANGYYAAEDEVSAWLDMHPGCMMGEYTRADNPPPAHQQWKISGGVDMKHLG
mgnify:CR=1 FL=1